MLAAVRKRGGDRIGASKVSASANDSGVNVKMPLVIDELKRTLIAEGSRAGTVRDPYDRDAAGHRQAATGDRELYGDNVAQLESAQWHLASAAAGIRAANRRVESLEIHRLAIDLELATDGAAICISSGG